MRYFLAGYIGLAIGAAFYFNGHPVIGWFVGLIAGITFQLIVWQLEWGDWTPWRTFK